jgi:hypothetical protein
MGGGHLPNRLPEGVGVDTSKKTEAPLPQGLLDPVHPSSPERARILADGVGVRIRGIAELGLRIFA